MKMEKNLKTLSHLYTSESMIPQPVKYNWFTMETNMRIKFIRLTDTVNFRVEIFLTNSNPSPHTQTNNSYRKSSQNFTI